VIFKENEYAVLNTARKFKKGNIKSLTEEIDFCEDNYPEMLNLAEKGPGTRTKRI